MRDGLENDPTILYAKGTMDLISSVSSSPRPSVGAFCIRQEPFCSYRGRLLWLLPPWEQESQSRW